MALGVMPCSIRVTRTESRIAVSPAVGLRRMMCMKVSSVKLTLPINSPIRSLSRTMISSALQVEMVVTGFFLVDMVLMASFSQVSRLSLA